MLKMLSLVVPALAAIFWGGVMLWMVATGRIGEFLVPKFHLIAMLGGLGMVVLGLFVLLTLKQSSSCGHDHCEDGHDHGEQSPLGIILLMMLPVGLALAADTSSGFSSDVLERKGLYDNSARMMAYELPPFTREMLEESTPKSEDGHFQLPVGQLYFSAGDPSMMKVLEGVAVETRGQIIAERDDVSGKRLRLYRTVMTCCAADAMVLSFPLEFETSLPTLEERTWVKVGGVLTYEKLPDGYYPMLKVARIEATEAPDFMSPGFW